MLNPIMGNEKLYACSSSSNNYFPNAMQKRKKEEEEKMKKNFSYLGNAICIK